MMEITDAMVERAALALVGTLAPDLSVDDEDRGIARRMLTAAFEPPPLPDMGPDPDEAPVPPGTYFIVEHPTRGTLKDLEETEGGRTSRFSATGLRNDPEKAMRFSTVESATQALRRIPRDYALQCNIRSNADDGTYEGMWPVVAAGRGVIS